MKHLARITALTALGLCTALFLRASSGASVQEEGVLDDTRNALSEWVEVRGVISKEKRDWELGKSILGDQIELLQRQIDALREEIGKANEDAAKLDVTRTELFEEDERLREASDVLAGMLTDFEARTSTLLERMPQPLQIQVAPLSQRFPEDPENTELSLSDRFSTIVGILALADKFNQEITAQSELRQLPSGEDASVTTLYLGLGQAYYATVDGTDAGIGTSGPDGWTWRDAGEHAEEIARAIAIFNNEDVADFVRLPIRID
ncbi:MAG: DUF3450 family protein [Planctomycetota bacterium]